MKIVAVLILTNVIANLVSYFFLFFPGNQKKESNFQPFDGLVMRNITVFSL